MDEQDPPVKVSQWVLDQHRAHRDKLRAHVGWLIWCYGQGYVKAEDRAPLTNWLLDDPVTLHPDDAALRPHLLAMADEVLATIERPGAGQPLSRKDD